jgi:hypothetical protein
VKLVNLETNLSIDRGDPSTEEKHL